MKPASAAVLRGAAALVVAGSFIGSTRAVLAPPKNPLAPLQPPDADLVGPPPPQARQPQPPQLDQT